MPDFVVDLQLHLYSPDAPDWEVSVAVTAQDRNDAAAVAIILASHRKWGPDKLMPKRVDWVAVEDGVEDGFDEDLRHLNEFVTEEERKALVEKWERDKPS
jgi:hypothetical protein